MADWQFLIIFTLIRCFHVSLSDFLCSFTWIAHSLFTKLVGSGVGHPLAPGVNGDIEIFFTDIICTAFTVRK